MNSANSRSKTPLQLIILNILALAGVGVSVALTQHFYDVRNGAAGFKSFCNTGQVMNCDIVAASPYAELFWGLPLSSFSAGWYLALFLVVLFAYNAYWRREAVRISFGLSVFGALLSFSYLFIMAIQLKTFCLLCLILDVFSFMAVVLVLTLKPEGFSEHKPDRSKWKTLGGIVGGALVISVLLLRTLEGTSLQDSYLNDLTDSVLNSPPVSVREESDLPALGPTHAPITIVEFSDFQCPFCRVGAFALNSVMNRYPGKIRVVFRNFPMDQSCNAILKQTLHPFACVAARTALCAFQQGKFESAYQEFFEKQSTLADGKVTDLIQGVGLDPSQLQACSSSQAVASAIARDVDAATTLGVKSTPTFFINGHKMEGAYPVPAWNRIIDKLLQK